jgi:site-specific recombinase
MSATDVTSGSTSIQPEESSLLARGNFVTRFAAAEPDNTCVRRLHALLIRLDAHAAFSSQAEWLEDLVAWVLQRGRVPGRLRGVSYATARLNLFLDAIELLPEQLSALRAVVARCFELTDGVRLFTDTGLPSRHAFVSEAIDRMSKQLLPEPPVEGDLSRLLFRLFPTPRAVDWFESLPFQLSHRLFSTLSLPSGVALEPLRTSMRDAAVLLAVRVSANGLADEVRGRLSRSAGALRDSPFLALPPIVRRWVAGGGKPVESAEVEVRECIAACRKAKREVIATLDQTGVSVDLVYRLELVARQLDRLYALVTVLSPSSPEGASDRLLQTLIRGGVRDRSLSELFRTNSRLLARRIIERAGHGGEHYITRTRAEQHQMVSSAAGGGAITSFSVLLKFLISWAHLPPLIEGLGLFLDYATGFVGMQLLGLTLATKQPAMTAATLAGGIKETTTAQGSEEADLRPLVAQVARVVRSQLAAAVGNLGMVIPVSILISLLWRLMTGHWVLDADYAHHLVAKHHLLLSPTIPYAMLTGVLLWVASLIGGTFENWFVVSKLPEAIASSRWLRALVGSDRARRFSRFVLVHISGFGGSVSLGFMLGMVGLLGHLVGIPIEVRHVTFATGQLTFSGISLGPTVVIQPEFLWAVAAIGVIGACNFGVSFALALFVALRAREVGVRAQVGLLRAVLRSFREAPLDFFRAPLAEVAPSTPTQ